MTSASEPPGTVLIVMLLIVGSLWIMYNMNANMLPMTRPAGTEGRDVMHMIEQQ